MAGRPTKYNDAIVEEIIGGIAVGLTDKDAAHAAGITEMTLGRWRKRYVDFDTRLMRARSQRTRVWLNGIRKAAIDTGDWRAYGELLDRCSSDYRKRQAVEHIGKGGGPVQHEHTHRVYDHSSLSLEEQFNLDQLLAKVQSGEVVD